MEEILNKLLLKEHKNLINFKGQYFQHFMICNHKIGGSSLFESLAHKYSVMHIHNSKLLNLICNDNIFIDDEHFLSFVNWNRDLSEKCDEHNSIYIYDGFREPLEWQFSIFFEHLIPIHKNKLSYQGKDFVEYYESNVDQLVKYFVENVYSSNIVYHPFIHFWTLDGLDIFKHKFDKKNGVTIYNHNGKKFLLYLFDHYNTINEVLDQENIHCIEKKERARNDTSLGNLYKLFKENVKLDMGAIDDLYSNYEHILNYFYDEDDIINIRRRLKKYEKKIEK